MSQSLATMDPLQEITKDPMDGSAVLVEDANTKVAEPSDDIKAQLVAMQNYMQKLSESMATLTTTINMQIEGTYVQFKELSTEIADEALTARANCEAIDIKLETHISNNHIRLAGMEVDVRRLNPTLTMHEIATRKDQYENLDIRMSTTERTLGTIQSTLNQLVGSKESTKSLKEDDPIINSSFTPDYFPTPYPTSTPTRGLTTPLARSHDERRLSPPENSITLEKANSNDSPTSQSKKKLVAKFCLLHYWCNHATDECHHILRFTDMERKRYRSEVGRKTTAASEVAADTTSMKALEPTSEFPPPVPHTSKTIPTTKFNNDKWTVVPSSKSRKRSYVAPGANRSKFRSPQFQPTLPTVVEDPAKDSISPNTKPFAETLTGSISSSSVSKVTILKRQPQPSIPATVALKSEQSTKPACPPRTRGFAVVAHKAIPSMPTSREKFGTPQRPKGPPAVAAKSIPFRVDKPVLLKAENLHAKMQESQMESTLGPEAHETNIYMNSTSVISTPASSETVPLCPAVSNACLCKDSLSADSFPIEMSQ